ncbi:MAG TPA: hypothetical protein VMU77_06520 [Acidimicrobiales bacterium]|nr:hypothetical protein [Acidimicrobiales bacterium]
MNRVGIGYDALLAFHIICGVVGFGTVGLTGWFANRALADPADRSVARYFTTGTNWAARVIYLVPLSGIGLLFMGNGSGQVAHEDWVIAGILLWLIAAALSGMYVWPAERRIQDWVNSSPTRQTNDLSASRIDRGPESAWQNPGVDSDLEGNIRVFPTGMRRTLATTSRVAGVCDLIYVCAFVVMIAKPGGA